MSILINLAAEFTGKKAFKDADSSIGSLEKGAKKLAKSLGAALSVKAVVDFGKASAEAFIKDQQEAAKLANVVKNLGMEFANPVIASYIDNLQRVAGVADSELRPALQTLLTQTGNLAKSQELLSLAIEVSRGSGESLATVSQDLAAAYVGNTKGLKKYNLGLTQAQLKTMDFTEVQKKLTNQFKGSNAAYLKTYAGQLEVLKNAAGEAQETIGKGLMDALALIAEDGSVQDLADAMQSFAENISNAIYGLGKMVEKLKAVGNAAPDWLKSYISNNLSNSVLPGPLGFAQKFWGKVTQYGEKEYNKTLQNPSVQMFFTDQANARLEREKYELTKKTLDIEKKKLAEARRQAALKKQAALFDLEKIGLVAALQGKITEEEKLRLNLQLALLTGNDELAKKLSAELANSIDKTGKLAKDLTTLPDAKNPFAAWSAFLDEIITKAKFAASIGGNGSAARGESFATLTPTVQSLVSGGGGAAGSTSAGDVYITVNGSVLSEQDLITAVQNGLNYNSLAGKPSDIGRIAGMFG